MLRPKAEGPRPKGSGIALAAAGLMEPEVVRHETIGGLIKGILQDLRTLVQEEIALARGEIREQAVRARAAAMSFGVAAAALLFGVAFLLIAMAIGIAELAAW